MSTRLVLQLLREAVKSDDEAWRVDAATLAPESAAVAGVVVRGEDVAWSAVLTVDEGTGEFVSVLSPVAPRRHVACA